MRSPVIAFSILAAAAAVSPTLVGAAPTSPNPDNSVTNAPRSFNRLVDTPASVPNPSNLVSGTPASGPAGAATGAEEGSPLNGVVNGVGIGSSNSGAAESTKHNDPNQHRTAEAQLHNPQANSIDYTSHSKRASDQYTAGGSAYSGATSDTSGGSVVNVAHGGAGDIGEDEGLVNDGGNTGGDAGDSYSGFVYGGDGDGKGAGGNAYSGAVGPSEGGRVISAEEDGPGIDNEDANTGGAGGFSESGDAQGGDAAGNVVDGVNTDDYTGKRKRAQDSGTAGGNAYTGASDDVDGGDVYNHADSEGEVLNDAAQTGGAAGDTYSGFANGGDGDGYGPGGNAYSGATGSAVGGSVVNVGGTVQNTATQAGGAGGESESGDAEGGDA